MSLIQLLQLEFKKFKNHTAIRLFGIMFLITMPSVLFVMKSFKSPNEMLFSISSIFQFPKVWDYLGYTTSWLVFFFLGFITLTSITSEVNYKTMRQNIITGVTRKNYFLSKLSSLVTISFLTTIFYTIIGFCIGAFHTESWDMAFAFDNKYAILKCFLMCMAYMSFALMIGLLVRRSGIAIFLYVCYIIFIESMLKWGSTKYIKTNLVNYYPLNTIEDLFPNPLYYMQENIPVKTIDFEFLLSNQHAIIFSCLWISVFTGIAYFSFMRRDI